ncbi:MAG: hypothetical protein FIB01_04175 [Gemmatimonadetes bacterium]|nr:hypothetical protein [Gemmatimonadota bacterium]
MLRSVLARLNSRKIGHWALAYLAGAWLLLQVLDLLAQPFAWPSLVLRAATVLLAIGFFAVLVIAWYHGEKGTQRVTGVELLMLAGILVIAGAAVAFVSRGSVRGSPAGGPVQVGAQVAEQGSIAVLPFADMSVGKDQEYFTDGLTEELLNALAKLPELRVASRTSAFAYKGKDVSVDSVARALKVANVLEGSVRKEGNQIRVTAQLIDAKTGYHRWSESYDRELAGVFALQDEIARRITEALQLKLGGERAAAPLVAQETEDPEAHTLVLKALSLRRVGTRESVQQAVGLLNQAIARDAQYARAYSELGRAYSYQAYQFFGRRDSLQALARSAAQQAVRLAPDDGESQYVLGTIARAEWDLRAAEQHYRRALRLNPGLAFTRSDLAWLLMIQGRTEESLAEAERAVQLDPVNLGLISNLAAMFMYAGQAERGITTMQDGLALAPESPVTLGNLALAYSYLGQHDEAIAAATKAKLHGGEDQYIIAVNGFVEARAGRRAEAQQALRALESQAETSHYLLATVYAGLGDREKVFAELDRAIAAKDISAQDVAVDPTFDPYRRDPRMTSLVKRAGLR